MKKINLDGDIYDLALTLNATTFNKMSKMVTFGNLESTYSDLIIVK